MAPAGAAARAAAERSALTNGAIADRYGAFVEAAHHGLVSIKPVVKQAPTLALVRRVAAALVVLGAAGLALAVWLLPAAQAPSVAPKGFTGRISDRDGKAIAGARIEATWIGQDEAPRSLTATSADSRGRYLLTVEPPPAEPGILALQVGATGFGTVGRRVTPAERKQDFRLVRGATRLTLRVATEDGVAVAAADVIASVEPVAGSPDDLVVLAGKTGADGVWTFDDLGIAPAEIHWIASAPGRGRGFGAVHKEAGDAPVEISAHLAAGSDVIGDIVDRDGTSVAGATVVAHEADGPWRDSASSDPAGAARISGAPRDTDLTLEVSGDWVLAGDSEQVPLRFSATERVRHVQLVVEPAGKIAGKVVTVRGVPVAAAVVSATPSDHVLTRNHAVATAPDGSFTLRGLRSHTSWDLEVRHPELAPAFVDGVSPVVRGLRIELHEGGTLVGAVDDDRPGPYPGVEIYAHRIAQGQARTIEGLREHATTTTRADGTFRIEHLSAGDYRVEYRSKARMAWSPTATQLATATVVDGQATALDRVRMSRGASLRVVARTAQGDLIAHQSMKVSILPANQGGAPHRFEARTGADGSFQINDLLGGTYQLAVRSESYGFERSSDLRLTAGATTTFDAAFPHGLELTGTVVDAARRPVVGALVDAYSAAPGGGPDPAPVGRAPDDFSGNFTHTDEAGRFRIAGLTPGTYRLRVSSPHSVPLAMDVRASGPASPLELQLPAPATLRVSVAGPQSTGSILIESHDGAGFSAAKAIGPDGTAEFSLLPAGDYKVRAALDRMLETHAQVRAGSDQTVQLDSRAPSAPSPAITEKSS